jgi:hypothetical protein
MATGAGADTTSTTVGPNGPCSQCSAEGDCYASIQRRRRYRSRSESVGVTWWAKSSAYREVWRQSMSLDHGQWINRVLLEQYRDSRPSPAERHGLTG